MEQRLQKLLAAAGVASRREAERLIEAGRVAVDGNVITRLGATADPEVARITVDGREIDLTPRKVYVLLNKPRGYASTRHDPHARRIVTDLVKDAGTNIYPVGRLDVDTEGLLILSNDGDFAFKMTHPSHRVPKTYRAEVNGLVPKEALTQLAGGIPLEDGMTGKAKVERVAMHTARFTTVVDMTITEGRKRQVRRMFDAVGHPVIRLARIKLGNLTLGKLKPGEWRFLTEQEVEGLLQIAA